MKDSKQLYTELTNSMIAILETQQTSWDKPWICLDGFGGLARNASSGRMYSIVNQIILGMALQKNHYTKNAWLTYRQLKELGGSIRKGAKSTPIYFNTYTWKDKLDRKYKWEEVKLLTDEQKKELEIKSSYYLTSFLVFNVAQTLELPDIYYQLPQQHLTISFQVKEVVTEILSSHDEVLKLSHEEIDEAYYNVTDDVLVLPTKGQFKTPEAYYSTLFHELVHWTGHLSRLNRLYLNDKDAENYAHEELVAELGSVFICAQLGLSKDISQNAAYVSHWLTELKKDNRYIMKMISFAERSTKFLLGDVKIEDVIEEYPIIEDSSIES